MADIAEKEKKGKLFTEEIDEKIVISGKTYLNYMKLARSNILIILTAILFVVSEGLYSLFYYYFGSYDY